MTASISLQVIGLFKLSTWSWFNFGMWYLYKKLSISFTLFNFMEYRFLWYELMILWVASVSVVIFPFSFLILLISMFSLCLLISLNKSLSVLLGFSNNQLFMLLIHSTGFFVSILLISVLSLIISCLLLLLGESFCCRAFRCAVKTLV